jgi:23S rRNA (pseudouridine1915-N3)-methyltransferase
VAVGSLDDAHLRALADVYLKRLNHYQPVEIVEVPETRGGFRNPAEIVSRDSERVRAQIPEPLPYTMLTPHGKTMDSPAFAAWLRARLDASVKPLVFVIGGSHGLSAEFEAGAETRLAFSPLTFPHQLFRVLFLEQLYRACTILNGEPYHK